MQTGIYHVPVLMHEVISGLQIDPSGTYVDCTFGGGGHSSGILQQLNNHGKLIAFDQDVDAIKNVPDDNTRALSGGISETGFHRTRVRPEVCRKWRRPLSSWKRH